MHIIRTQTQSLVRVRIEPVVNTDYKGLTKSRFWFDWKTEKEKLVYKLVIEETKEIVGLMSMTHFKDEQRFEIGLLAVSRENRGKNKIYDGIAARLIAFACREALKLHGADACVSLTPKTEIKAHYIRKYGMQNAGTQVFLEGRPLLRILKTLDDENE